MMYFVTAAFFLRRMFFFSGQMIAPGLVMLLDPGSRRGRRGGADGKNINRFSKQFLNKINGFKIIRR